MTESRKLRVFLCHSSQDKSIVRELYQRLLAEDWIDPWLDEVKLLPGQDWDMEIEKAVEAADAVIVCLSNGSVSKEGYIQRELKFVLDIALEKPEGTIFVIPLLLNKCEVPRRIRSWQYVNYFPKAKRDQSFGQLLESLRSRATALGIHLNSAPDVRIKLNNRSQLESKRILLGILGLVLVISVSSVLYFKERTPSSPSASVSPTLRVTLISSKTATSQPESTSTPKATPTLVPGATQISPKDNTVFLYIPAGEFIMGSNSGFPDEKPEHKVYLDAFWISQTEVTNAVYSLCVDASVCRPPSRTDYYSRDASSPEYPVVFISWDDAKSYCEWTGSRLPTEAEWEKAARGVNGLIYPWGNQFECQRGNFDDETSEDAATVPGGPNCDGYKYIAPVGSFQNGKSIYGALDMAGNVWEWVSDWYGDSYYYKYVKTSIPNPKGPDLGNRRVVKGGACLNDKDVFSRGSNRYSYPPELVDDNVGFRCVMPVK